MKRPVVLLIMTSLIVAAALLTLGVYFFIVAKKPPVVETREVIKTFSFSSPNSLDEWDEKILAKSSSGYSVVEYEGEKCVRADSVNACSALFFKKRLSSKRDIYVSWDWKADKFPDRKKAETLEKKKEFDFVAQVYVVFYAKFFLNSKAIQYVWTEEVPVGTHTDSPYTKKVQLLVLQSGPSEEWKHEERDIRKDYFDLFGEELGKDIAAVAFMTDSDSTGTTASAYFDNIEIGFLGKASDEPLSLDPVDEKDKSAASLDVSDTEEVQEAAN